MTSWIVPIVASLMLLGAPSLGGAACDPEGADAPDIADARDAIAASCDCAGATSPGVYKRCAKETARTALANRGCLPAVMRCAAKSTCGRPGAAVCCRTNAAGQTKGTIVRSVDRCTASRTGTACVGSGASVCDACTVSGCTPEPVCGNDRLDVGEQCDGQGFCTADCRVRAVSCCQGENTCRDIGIFSAAQHYLYCSPDEPVRGTCVGGTTCDPLIVEPDTVCCAFEDADCRTESFSTAEGYHNATYACLISYGQATIGGVCGADQRCHPPD